VRHLLRDVVAKRARHVINAKAGCCFQHRVKGGWRLCLYFRGCQQQHLEE